MKFKKTVIQPKIQREEIKLVPIQLQSVNEPVAIPGDSLEFQKQVYSTIQQFILNKDRDWAKNTLMKVKSFQPQMLQNLVDRVLQDGLRANLLKISKSPEDFKDEQQSLMTLKALGLFIGYCQDLEQCLDLKVEETFVQHIALKHEEQLNNAIQILFKLVVCILNDHGDQKNVQALISAFDKVLTVLSHNQAFNSLVQNLLNQMFDDIEADDQKRQLLKLLDSFNFATKKLLRKQLMNLTNLDDALQSALSSANQPDFVEIIQLTNTYSSDPQNFFKSLTRHLQIYFSEKLHYSKPIVLSLIETRGQLIDLLLNASRTPAINLTTQDLLKSINEASILFLKFNSSKSISKLVAEALFYQIDKNQNLQEILTFSNDKDSLEIELRILIISAYIDGKMPSDPEVTKEFYLQLTSYFGAKFCNKFLAISKEVSNNQMRLNDGSSDALTIPQSLWPFEIQMAIPCFKTMHSIHDSFKDQYAAKYHKRKIQSIKSYLGFVDVKYMNKQDVVVSGIQAQVLLKFNEKHKWSKNDLKQYLNISNSTDFDKVVDSLELFLKEDEQQNLIVQKNGKLNEKSICMKSVDIMNLLQNLQQKQSCSKQKEQLADGPSLEQKYVHKEHKFRVQSYIIKMLKKELTINFDEMFKRVEEYFSENKSCLIKLEKENISKNIEDLETKGYLEKDEDLGFYEYVVG